MPNPTITTCHSAPSCIVEGAKYRQDTLYFSGADTWAQNTILGRKLISDTVSVAYTRAGTSTYTVAAACDAYKTLQAGAYVCTAGTMSTGAGPWTCVAPDGSAETITTTAAGDNLHFHNLGLSLTTTAGGGTDWDTGDVITCTAAAQTGTPLVLFDIDGTNGAQVPVAILPYAVTTTGSGSVAADAMFAGVVRKEKLVIDADGDSTNVSDHVCDQLANAGFTVVFCTDVSVLDNGAS